MWNPALDSTVRPHWTSLLVLAEDIRLPSLKWSFSTLKATIADMILSSLYFIIDSHTFLWFLSAAWDSCLVRVLRWSFKSFAIKILMRKTLQCTVVTKWWLMLKFITDISLKLWSFNKSSLFLGIKVYCTL